VTSNLKTKYLIGIATLASILLSSFTGFSLIRLSYQPQISNLTDELSNLREQLNSNITALIGKISAMQINISALQLRNAILDASINALGDSYSSLQLQCSSLNAKINNLTDELSNLHRQLDSYIASLNAELSHVEEELNSNITSLTASINALGDSYSSLQVLYSSLNANFTSLEDYVHKISLVSSSSHYIFKKNNVYYAQNGANGTIEYNSENCSAVIDYAFAHVPFGGEVLLKPLASETDAYYTDSTLYPPNGTTLASENRMVTICLNNNSKKDVIDLHNVHDVQLRNIRIYGNRWNNATGNGIVIESTTFRGSNDLIENVVVDDCKETGIWVQNNQLDNAFRNVRVFHSGAYNIRVDSADNQLIDVQSGWAGLSGFDVIDGDNYFLNCISWGCGNAGDLVDCNGFSIYGARNMFIGCDADRNDGGGFVLANANQTMLASCIGRNNGQRVSGCWGFDLYNSIGTVMSASVATDEQPRKTQDYAFTEGGDSDYNIVTGCNFDGNRVGAVFALVGMHSTITDTVGYETKSFSCSNFRYLGTSIAVGANDIYGNPANFTSSQKTIVDFHVTIKCYNVSSSENVTVRVQALMANGSATFFEVSTNVTGIYILNEEDISGLWSSWSIDNPIVELQISAKTTVNATEVAVSVYVWGSGK